MTDELNGEFDLLRVVDVDVAVDAPVDVGGVAAAPPAPEVPPNMPVVLVLCYYYVGRRRGERRGRGARLLLSVRKRVLGASEVSVSCSGG